MNGRICLKLTAIIALIIFFSGCVKNYTPPESADLASIGMLKVNKWSSAGILFIFTDPLTCKHQNTLHQTFKESQLGSETPIQADVLTTILMSYFQFNQHGDITFSFYPKKNHHYGIEAGPSGINNKFRVRLLDITNPSYIRTVKFKKREYSELSGCKDKI